jgi:peptidoglycan hydrolase-like protein with peptidoglycan-binding domain
VIISPAARGRQVLVCQARQEVAPAWALHGWPADLELPWSLGLRWVTNGKGIEMAISIRGSVGRGGTNRFEDVCVVQELLNKQSIPPLSPLAVDGIVGPKTIAAIESFQRRVLSISHPDGRVDPGGPTLAALVRSASPPSTPPYRLPTEPGKPGLSEADFVRAAGTLLCEIASIKAAAEVESSGDGYLPSGRPKILFEAHVFSRETQGTYDRTHPDISSPTWNRALYKGGEKEYERLEKAMALDVQAALESASWGRFQIMGFNHQKAGFTSVETFVNAMCESESWHLDAFVTFLQATGLAEPLREKRWADFARGYNGAGFAANQYDVKLEAAYDKYRRQEQ